MAKKRKCSTGLTARNADRHALYEISVQRPELMVDFIDDLSEHMWDKSFVTLREDFCGTANLASAWVQGDGCRKAVAIDLDESTLDWAKSHNQMPLGKASKRLTLICDDVMNVRKKSDVTVSLNFSHFIFKQRQQLKNYLKHVWRNLNRPGLLVLDLFGGPGSITPDVDERNFSEFDYQWEQGQFNPLTNEMDCHIHFRFKNGTKIRNAFSYDWRMWSIPELLELLEEVGFTRQTVYFETEQGFDTEVPDHAIDAWVAYIVAVK